MESVESDSSSQSEFLVLYWSSKEVLKQVVVSTSNNKGEGREASDLGFMRPGLDFDVLHEILGLELDVLAVLQVLHGPL